MQSQVALTDRLPGLRPPPTPYPFSLSVYPGPFLMVVATGSGGLADVVSAVDLLAAVAIRSGHARALLDLMAVETELSPVDHITLRTQMAYALQSFDRVACVVPAWYGCRGGETSAPAGRLNVRTFIALNDAIDWVQDFRGPALSRL